MYMALMIVAGILVSTGATVIIDAVDSVTVVNLT